MYDFLNIPPFLIELCIVILRRGERGERGGGVSTEKPFASFVCSTLLSDSALRDVGTGLALEAKRAVCCECEMRNLCPLSLFHFHFTVVSALFSCTYARDSQ